MTDLLDAQGQPYREEEAARFCPCCGSNDKDHETVGGFGGYSRVVCKKCGAVIGAAS